MDRDGDGDGNGFMKELGVHRNLSWKMTLINGRVIDTPILTHIHHFVDNGTALRLDSDTVRLMKKRRKC